MPPRKQFSRLKFLPSPAAARAACPVLGRAYPVDAISPRSQHRAEYRERWQWGQCNAISSHYAHPSSYQGSICKQSGTAQNKKLLSSALLTLTLG